MPVLLITSATLVPVMIHFTCDSCHFRVFADVIWFPNNIGDTQSQRVRRTPNPFASPIQYMSTDHCGLHMTMTEQLLNGSDVVTVC